MSFTDTQMAWAITLTQNPKAAALIPQVSTNQPTTLNSRQLYPSISRLTVGKMSESGRWGLGRISFKER